MGFAWLGGVPIAHWIVDGRRGIPGIDIRPCTWGIPGKRHLRDA
jgi:hypothetical protein